MVRGISSSLARSAEVRRSTKQLEVAGRARASGNYALVRRAARVVLRLVPLLSCCGTSYHHDRVGSTIVPWSSVVHYYYCYYSHDALMRTPILPPVPPLVRGRWQPPEQDAQPTASRAGGRSRRAAYHHLLPLVPGWCCWCVAVLAASCSARAQLLKMRARAFRLQ